MIIDNPNYIVNKLEIRKLRALSKFEIKSYEKMQLARNV